MRWKVIPLSGQDVILAAESGGISSKARHLTSRRKGLSSKAASGADRSPPPLEGIDKTGDYRYDLPRFHIGAPSHTGPLPPTEIEQPSPIELLLRSQ